MDANGWERVKAIFNEVVERAPAERTEFLLQSCGGDQDLQREVESLLAFDSDGEVSSVLDQPALQPLPPLPEPASLTLKDRYTVVRELGRGGMSAVYLAQDRQLLSKRVVVKVLLKETSQDPWVRQKFKQEMEALARIDHPGVVGVLDTGLTADGYQFLVMQYIEGITLRGAIEPGGMKPARAAGIIRQIGQALAAAHEKGVWHRDLKPENIMLQALGGDDHVKLIDFGIASIQNSEFRGEKTKVAGSWTYMAPEQLTGKSCAATDTYALGVVAYEMLTGTPPGTQREVQPQLSPAAERSILKAMSYRPELRHSEVREFTEELSQILAGGEPVRRRTSPGSIEIAHVLFIDLVGYSMLPMDQQKEYLEQLQQIVRESPQFQAAESGGDLINLPTGDGMALAFFGDPIAPAQCAVELAAGLKGKKQLKLRMGIHSGPVYRVADMNANANVAGGGINMAQRVMDCGDAGHILVSKTMAEVLAQLSEWSPHMTDLGECEVKHGVRLHLSSLVTSEAGNPIRPRKLAKPTELRAKGKLKGLVASAALTVILIAAGAVWVKRDGTYFGARMGQPSMSSIAVLPFVNMSSDKDQEYISDGLAEELLNALAKIPGLRVAARTSSFQFKGKAVDSAVIGKALHVGAILEGSMRKQGTRARIGVQLIQAQEGSHLWSETYDRELNDILAVQDEIARAVTSVMRIEFMGQKAVVTNAQNTNPETYRAYLQGRYFLRQGNKVNLEKAVEYFEQATQLDPRYSPAWTGLGGSRIAQASAGYVPSEEGFRKAREALKKALELNPNMGEAHADLGFIQMFHDWDWTAADAHYRRAQILEPGNSIVLGQAASQARILGRWDESIALYRRAVEIDPLGASNYNNFGFVLLFVGKYDEAAAAFAKVLELTPQNIVAHSALGRVYLRQGRLQDALAEMDKEKHPALRLFGLAMVNHALGKSKDSDANLAELIEKFQADAPSQIAEVYAFRGEGDRAFEWFERAYRDRDTGVAEIKESPFLGKIKSDPRYQRFLKKLGLPL